MILLGKGPKAPINHRDLLFWTKWLLRQRDGYIQNKKSFIGWRGLEGVGSSDDLNGDPGEFNDKVLIVHESQNNKIQACRVLAKEVQLLSLGPNIYLPLHISFLSGFARGEEVQTGWWKNFLTMWCNKYLNRVSFMEMRMSLYLRGASSSK